MKLMRFVFFSVNDFSKDGGSTIRMSGIMNELIARGHEVIFFSNLNQCNNTEFSRKIRVVHLDYTFSSKEKRIFQGLLGILPVSAVNFFYKGLLKRMKTLFKENLVQSNIIFFEYLDNSIGYWLKKNDLVQGYINDLHGVATLEFKFQAKLSNKLINKIKFYSKYLISSFLDKKVFCNATGLIFASKAMELFFAKQYPIILKKKNYILPYLLNSKSCEEIVDLKLKNKLIEKYSIKKTEKVILFSGAFKKSGGVPDLIEAYNIIVSNFQNSKLLLIGDGPTMKECNSLVGRFNLQGKVIFVGRTKYQHLKTYQDIANVIVCPDKQNVYSELIIHVKYLDALISGRIVINGSFKSVLEVNINESLSINFEPSNIDSLAHALETALKNYEELCDKYGKNTNYIYENLTYKSHISILEN